MLEDIRKSLRAVIQSKMSQDPAHDLAHLDRVWTNGRRIAKSVGDINMKVLLGAAYLHDFINLPKDDPNRSQASTMSAVEAAPILVELGFTESEVEEAQHAIRAHSYSAGITPETPEAKILRDADRLDALGAIGIARVFAVGGALGRALYDPTDPFAEGRELDDQSNTLDHWHIKLLKLPSDMLTEKGREIANKRVSLMLSFLEQFGKETDTIVPEEWSSLIAEDREPLLAGE